MNTGTEVKVSNNYFNVANGANPEAMPSVAYRRVGHPELVGRKLIKCPFCRGLLIYVNRNISVRIYHMPRGKHQNVPDLFVKRCNSCKKEVGFVITT